MFLAMTANSIIRGEGEMKFPMYAMASASILNILLDPLFIFTFGWGVSGAAAATVLSRAVALLIVALYLTSERTWIKLSCCKFRLIMSHVKGIFSVGIPSSLSNLSMSFGMFLLTSIVAGFGTEALAAFGVGFRLDTIAFLPAMGVSIAVVSLVGQNVGASKFDRAEEITLKAAFLATAFMIPIGIVFYTYASQIVSVFNQDPLVVAYGASLLKIFTLSYLMVGFIMAISSAFLGSGHAIPSLFINTLRMLVLGVPLAYLFSKKIGLDGVWWGIIAGTLVTYFIALLWFKKGSWKTHPQNQIKPSVSS